MADAYGSAIATNGQRLSYTVWVGLWLNRIRILYRRAGAVATGIGVAFGGKGSRDFFDALTDSKSQADIMEGTVSAAQQEARQTAPDVNGFRERF